MLDQSDLKPCGACNELFGRHRVGFQAHFEDGETRTNWLGEDILVCTLCKRNPAQHMRWRKMYQKNKPWTKGELAREDKPEKVDLLFEDLLVPNQSGEKN